MDVRDIKQTVKEKYRQAALRVSSGGSSCCGASASSGACDPITSNLYASGETAALPAEAVAASLGCGNPTALAELSPGETVLDLGSGGGIDVLLSARRVGPTGKAYGLDMTDEMLALAGAEPAGVRARRRRGGNRGRGPRARRVTSVNARAATPADAGAIARIYNEGIEDRIATFETRPRSAADIAAWFEFEDL